MDSKKPDQQEKEKMKKFLDNSFVQGTIKFFKFIYSLYAVPKDYLSKKIGIFVRHVDDKTDPELGYKMFKYSKKAWHIWVILMLPVIFIIVYSFWVPTPKYFSDNISTNNVQTQQVLTTSSVEAPLLWSSQTNGTIPTATQISQFLDTTSSTSSSQYLRIENATSNDTWTTYNTNNTNITLTLVVQGTWNYKVTGSGTTGQPAKTQTSTLPVFMHINNSVVSGNGNTTYSQDFTKSDTFSINYTDITSVDLYYGDIDYVTTVDYNNPPTTPGAITDLTPSTSSWNTITSTSYGTTGSQITGFDFNTGAVLPGQFNTPMPTWAMYTTWGTYAIIFALITLSWFWFSKYREVPSMIEEIEDEQLVLENDKKVNGPSKDEKVKSTIGLSHSIGGNSKTTTKKPVAKKTTTTKKAPAKDSKTKETKAPAKEDSKTKETKAPAKEDSKTKETKAPVANKTTTSKKAPAKKPVAKKTTTTKKAPAKKPVAKKTTTTKKAPAKKPVAKKTTTTKTTNKKGKGVQK